MGRPRKNPEPVEEVQAPSTEGLVLMTKGGETIPVHPTCVQAHKNAGWKVQE